MAEYATLNANYLMAQLRTANFEVAFPRRRASHEFIITLKRLKEKLGSAPWTWPSVCLTRASTRPTYFPLLVPECLLIEPTETESKQTLDAFVAAMKEILAEARATPELVRALRTAGTAS